MTVFQSSQVSTPKLIKLYLSVPGTIIQYIHHSHLRDSPTLKNLVHSDSIYYTDTILVTLFWCHKCLEIHLVGCQYNCGCISHTLSGTVNQSCLLLTFYFNDYLARQEPDFQSFKQMPKSQEPLPLMMFCSKVQLLCYWKHNRVYNALQTNF